MWINLCFSLPAAADAEAVAAAEDAVDAAAEVAADAAAGAAAVAAAAVALAVAACRGAVAGPGAEGQHSIGYSISARLHRADRYRPGASRCAGDAIYLDIEGSFRCLGIVG